MIRYRLTESGVEFIDRNHSTFIPSDPENAAWCDFLTWLGVGNTYEQALRRPYSSDPGVTDRLFIIGAGGFGREVFSMTHSARGADIEWRVAGYLNDVKEALDLFKGYPPIIADTNYKPAAGDAFICAIGDLRGRRAVCEKFEVRGAKFVNIISEGARISDSASIGKGIIVEAFTGIAANAHIGDFTTILGHAIVGHDVHIGRYCQISPYCDIHGWAEVGDECLIGSHSVILKKVKIGSGATVGAGSVVLTDVPSGATVFGVPARRGK